MQIFDIKNLAENFGIDLKTIVNRPASASDRGENEPSK
jgi:hypothetical protein